MSLPTMHPAKKRRLDESTSQLSKPFKSPLRPATLKEQAQGAARQDLPTTKTRPLRFASTEEDTSSLSLSLNSSTPRGSIHSGQTRRPPTIISRSSRNPPKDPQLLALQKQHSALLFQLSKLRRSAETAQQALKIVSSQQDAELETLISRWRVASREAAEELFRGAKDRVNRMGGVGAWRERSRKRPPGWDDEENTDHESMTEDQKEQLQIRKEELQAEIGKYRLGEAQVAEEKEDKSFTMDMMLNSLNVELNIIGFDPENQRWTD